MTSEDVQTNLRLPAELKERVVKAAAQNKRSLSAEVAARLEQSFKVYAGAEAAIHGTSSAIGISDASLKLSDAMEQLKLKYSRLGVLIAELTSIRQYRMQLRMDVRQDGLEVSDETFNGLDIEEEQFSNEAQVLRKEIDDLQQFIATKGDERFNLAA